MRRSKDKTHNLPGEYAEMWAKVIAANDCFESAVESLFGKRRAIYYRQKYHSLRRKFWLSVYELYPEYKCTNTELTYIFEENIITVTKTKEDD